MGTSASELDRARQDIDRIDSRIADLFSERMRAVEEVSRYKREHGLPITDASREEEVIARGAERIEDPVIRDFYVTFLRSTMDISKAYQSRLQRGMKVAYSGTAGAFAHTAASRIFGDGRTEGFGNFREAYDSVKDGTCDCAVLPLENSFAGEVGQVIDMLFLGPLSVSGVYELPVVHDLAGLPGTTVGDIKTVVSHPQALSQCASYIKSRGFSQIEYENTATAAEMVSKRNDRTLAAICSRECAGIFGLSVLEHGINESRSNTTKFGVFTRTLPVPAAGGTASQDDRFLIMFTVRNETGSLAEAINIIGRHGYNMSALRSRPMKELPWNYYFYVECEGLLTEADRRALLAGLSVCCGRLKIAGIYKDRVLPDRQDV